MPPEAAPHPLKRLRTDSMSSSSSQQLAPRLQSSSPLGCQHCVTCAALTFPEAALSRSHGASREFQEWWPAGLQSPTVYFYLRAKQLKYLLRHGGSEAYELWRPFRDCDYRCCTMLRRRGRPPLAIHVPAAQTGIDQNEDNEPQFVRAVSVPVCAAATPGATCTPRPSPFSAPVAAAAPSAAALAAAKLASAAALAAPASAASLAPTTAAQQQLTGSGSRSRPLHRSWHALAAELQALASPAHSSRGSLALSGSGESSSGSLSQGSPSPASVLRLQGAALPPRPPLAAALARLDCASARWQQAKAHLLAARAPPPQQLPQPQQQLFSASLAAAALPSAGAPASCCQPPAAWAAARVPAVPMLPV